MRAIIGGPPSTGSSLLARILNRHSSIYCSPDESHLFSKDELYTSWDKSRIKILKSEYPALRSPGWHLFNGVLLEESDWNIKELKLLIDDSDTFELFAEAYYARIMTGFNKQIWIEKTPGNILCFTAFLQMFDDSITIATIRDPFEIIASLLNRGLSIYNAVGVTLTNYAFVPEPNERNVVVKYEELKSNSIDILTKLCKSLSVQFEKSMVTPDKSYVKMKGWRYSETSEVSSINESRFDQLDSTTQGKIRYAAELMLISKNWSKWQQGNLPKSISDICNLWGYTYKSGATKPFSMKTEMVKDRARRTARGYPTHTFNYPINLK